jgi:predicted Zn-dependent peptidase
MPFDEIEAGLDAVTSEQVLALAQTIFQPGAMALVLLGPLDGLKIDDTCLEV